MEHPVAKFALEAALANVHVFYVALEVGLLGERFIALFTRVEPQSVMDALMLLERDSLVKSHLT